MSPRHNRKGWTGLINRLVHPFRPPTRSPPQRITREPSPSSRPPIELASDYPSGIEPSERPFWNEFDDRPIPVRRTKRRWQTRRRKYRTFEEHLDVFLSTLPVDQMTDSEQAEAWSEYLDIWYENRGNRYEWLDDWGIDYRDFDWDGWRDAMGYSRKAS
jgi:hypothetical protein